MSSIIVKKGTILGLEFFFNRENHLHYWCLSHGPIIPGRDFYKTTKELKLFLVHKKGLSNDCSPSTIFSGKVEHKENCNKERMIKELDEMYSRKNGGEIPDGYVSSENYSVVIFKSEYLEKIENTTSSSRRSVDEQ